MRRCRSVSVSVALALAVATPVRAQGKGKGPPSHPPSSSSLPSPTVVAPATIGAAPFAWIDDASMLPPGAMAGSFLVVGWAGTAASEVDAPVVGFAAGLAPRLQLGASVPHVVGNDVSGVVGGLGTTYLSAKVGVLTGGASGVKVAVAPTVEILGAGALQSLAPGTGRTQFGLPASLEVDHGPARVFASTGFFSQGVWFAGGGVGAQVTPRVAVSAAFSRAWTASPINGASGDRREISGSVAFSPRPGLSLFGSLGRTLATSDLDGAGTTVTGGVMFVLASSTGK